MEKLIVLGTGNALATKCYNTCFALQEDNEILLVDAGGGNGILRILEEKNISENSLHNMIVTHEHCDHLLGVVWIIRKIATAIKQETYSGNFTIYCHTKLAEIIKTMCQLTLQKKFTDLFDNRILFVKVTDGISYTILDRKFTFFNIHSTKAEQYGFSMILQNGGKLTCLGDEPYNSLCEKYVSGSNWLLSEAFCLYSQRDIFKPYEKHHSTVKEACMLAEELKIENLILWHTEDENYENRKELYTTEASNFYHGNLYVPYDGEILIL